MPRKPTGHVEEYVHKDGETITYRVRFQAFGQRQRLALGTNHAGWSTQRARNELDRILDQVKRGTWVPPAPRYVRAPLTNEGETVAVTVSRWWDRRKGEIAERTREDYMWRINHILRELQDEETASLDAQRVDEFRSRLVKKDLAPRSINMILDLLAQALDDAVDYRIILHNPARGRRRRVKVPKPRRSFLEPDMVADLLQVAGEWEATLPPHQQYGRRALLALLCLSGGPRISEVIMADRGDIDLHAGRWRIPASKTDAGARDVELTAYTLGELRAHLARRPLKATSPLFPTWSGGRLNASNIRNRLVREVANRVNEQRAQEGRMLLPDKIGPHGLRRTYVSLTLTAGRDPRFVMAQVGHTDARLTLSVYAQIMNRQRVDHQQVWDLCRFTDEPANWADRNAKRSSNSPTTTGEDIRPTT